ncbi:hypothetical protein EDC01DRAFT_653545 [Geopyxis carbonaria]|nr:hypothetical protein EDC01DRAFT_653545 [Geopyxis carbonaria]
MATTPPPTVPEPQLCKEDVEHLQRIITIYHARLNAAWATHFRGEAVPPGHENAPDITSWAPSKVTRVLQNFRRHLLFRYYLHNVTAAMLNRTLLLIRSGLWLVTNFANPDVTPPELASARQITADDLEAVVRMLRVSEDGEMRPLWIDRGEEREREMFARRVQQVGRVAHLRSALYRD